MNPTVFWPTLLGLCFLLAGVISRALALFATVASNLSPRAKRSIATIARRWTGTVLVAYGVQHFAHPEFTAGVPSPVPTAAWVPLPLALPYATGSLLIACGLMMLLRKRPGTAAALGGSFMVLLTVALYGPQFFLATSAGEQVTAVNFIFDTLLFGGALLVISKAVSDRDPQPMAASYEVALVGG